MLTAAHLPMTAWLFKQNMDSSTSSAVKRNDLHSGEIFMNAIAVRQPISENKAAADEQALKRRQYLAAMASYQTNQVPQELKTRTIG
jgi:hypothetical protein